MVTWGKVGITCICILCFCNSGYSQVQLGESVSFHGVIEQVAEDFRFVVINEIRVGLSSSTKLSDEGGREVKVVDLRPKMRIELEVVRSPNGFLARRIVVKRKI